jgi:hypothetical protein
MRGHRLVLIAARWLALPSATLLSSSVAFAADPPIAPVPPPPAPPPMPPRVSPPDVPPLAVEPPSPAQTALNVPEGAVSFAKKLDEADYTTRRYEPAGFPLIGGNSDIGFQIGAVGTLSHFADGIKPYAWNLDAVVSASLKDGPAGVQFVQQSYLLNADLPGYLGGKLRFNPQVQYQRTINQGYFGLGDAASGTVPANYTGPAGRYFEWIDSIANAYFQGRYIFHDPWSVSGAVGYRYMDPTAYADSKLARDAMAKNPDGSPVIHGLTPLSVTQLAVGGSYDSRDNEIFPRAGAIGVLGVAYQQGIPLDASVQYGEAQALIQGYRSIGGPFVLAARAVADFQFGHVPFYDLSMSGPFAQSEAIGGGSAIRGVPVGRYAGEIKIYGNVELRGMFVKFHVWNHKVSLGADALFDTGRSWFDYTFNSPLDGHGLGIKYGAGGGIYVLWGQAAIFRVDAAYSPDAAAENPSFPLGLYVADGVMF